LNDGWSLGSHGSDNSCQDYQNGPIIDSFERLEEIVADSNRSDYYVTSFSAPCFISDYHPVILDLRDGNDVDVLFNESGNDYLLNFDNAEYQKIGNYGLVPFTFDGQIGRGQSINSGDVGETIATFDLISNHYKTSGERIWFNTLSHDGLVNVIDQSLSYLHSTYGPGGSDEVWVAPSDEIYSYQVIRLQGGLQLVGITQIGS
ncbi:MAG: hypothetical protein AAF633_07495, partial [Chloroflexota bacterium]